MLRVPITVGVLALLAAAPAAAQIVGGSETDGFEATVALLQDLGGGSANFFCSGTLIRPDVVLTAAHCLIYEPDFVYFGPEPFGGGGIYVDGAGFEIHPDWDGLVDGPPDSDIAVVFLDAPVVFAAPVRERIDDLSSLSSGSVLYVGFGTNQVGGEEDDVIKRMATSDVDEVYSDLLLTSPDDGAPCFGDSGGSAYTGTGATLRVAGVTSFVMSEDCDADGAGATRTDWYADWIEDEAGSWQEPDDDDDSSDDDDAGDDDDDDTSDDDDDTSDDDDQTNSVGDGTTTLGSLQEDRDAGCHASLAGAAAPGSVALLLLVGVRRRRAG